MSGAIAAEQFSYSLARRLAAFSIDGIIIFILVIIGKILFSKSHADLICLAYFFQISFWGTTVGGRLFGIYILQKDGKSLGRKYSNGRALILLLVLGIGYILKDLLNILYFPFPVGLLLMLALYGIFALPALFTEEKITLYDLFSKTRVIYRPEKDPFAASKYKNFVTISIATTAMLLTVGNLALEQIYKLSMPSMCIKHYSDAQYTEALPYCLKGAALMNRESAYTLGAMYENGRGVEKDYALAAKYYLQSVAFGFSKGMVSLALLYQQGKGVAKNVSEAVDLIETAANKGEISAQLILGEWYNSGEVVPRDKVKAYLWLSLALNNMSLTGLEALKYSNLQDKEQAMLDNLKIQMSRDELLKAEALIKGWKKQAFMGIW